MGGGGAWWPGGPLSEWHKRLFLSAHIVGIFIELLEHIGKRASWLSDVEREACTSTFIKFGFSFYVYDYICVCVRDRQYRHRLLASNTKF